MIDPKTLQRALLIGTALQVAMVVSGHFVPFVALKVFAIGGMALSAIAGFVYGREASGFGGAAIGGAVAGAGCALIAIALSVLLGDTKPVILAVGTSGSAIAGALGGLLGKALSGRRAA